MCPSLGPFLHLQLPSGLPPPTCWSGCHLVVSPAPPSSLPGLISQSWQRAWPRLRDGMLASVSPVVHKAGRVGRFGSVSPALNVGVLSGSEAFSVSTCSFPLLPSALGRRGPGCCWPVPQPSRGVCCWVGRPRGLARLIWCEVRCPSRRPALPAVAVVRAAVCTPFAASVSWSLLVSLPAPGTGRAASTPGRLLIKSGCSDSHGSVPLPKARGCQHHCPRRGSLCLRT